MLNSLTINNIVLIDSLHIDFEGGLCVLSGETGAGKSILMDSLGLAMGGRSERELVRHGAAKASVTADFTLPEQHALWLFLDSQDLSHEGGQIILRRTLTQDGRSRAFINDRPVSVGLLAKVGDMLVEIHGQHDERGLLNSAGHRKILDDYGHTLINMRQFWIKTPLEGAMRQIGQLLATLLILTPLILTEVISSPGRAEVCLNPPGWLPENLPELLFNHHVWATEQLPPYLGDPRRLNLCQADLSGLDFSGANLTDADLSTTRLVGTNFSGADLNGVRLDGAYIQDSNFAGTNLKGASLRRVEITGSRFVDADLEAALFQDTKIQLSDFTRVRLDKAKFWRVDLSDLMMQNANLTGADFIRSSFEKIDFTGADLSQADLRQAKLRDIIFKDSLLYLTNLRRIDIGGDKRDVLAAFCRRLAQARDWQFSYRDKKLLCGGKILPGKHPLSGAE